MIPKQMAAEFFGTFWLVFGGCGSRRSTQERRDAQEGDQGGAGQRGDRGRHGSEAGLGRTRAEGAWVPVWQTRSR